MSRIVYAIRHADSTGTRHNRHLFGPEGAPLSPEGITKSKALRSVLEELGIEPTTAPAAVSELIRTHETAHNAGFRHITQYRSLNEINSGLEPAALEAMIEEKTLPEAAYRAARLILDNPPQENVWVTHGMVIGALAHELGIPTDELFIPEMGTTTKLELP